MARVLPEFVWVVGEDGALTEVPAMLAAKLLVGKSHRQATAEEIRVRQEATKARKKEAAAKRRRKRGIETVAVDSLPSED